MADPLNSVRLIQDDEELLEALESPRRFLMFHGADVSRHLETARDVVRQTLEFERKVRARPPWTGYLAVDDRTNVVVGACGFKGNPTLDGSVEIAYFTFDGFEGQGVATRMARMLIDISMDAPEVSRVLAHTLPEPGASTSVLTRLGFRNIGTFDDEQDGSVWRWERSLEA